MVFQDQGLLQTLLGDNFRVGWYLRNHDPCVFKRSDKASLYDSGLLLENQKCPPFVIFVLEMLDGSVLWASHRKSQQRPMADE